MADDPMADQHATPGAAGASLAGRRIGVTADRRFEEQAAMFRKRGAEVVHGPTLRTVDLSRDERLRRVTEELADRPPTYLVVSTGIGLRMWLEAAAGWGLDGPLKQALAGSVIVARGAKGASTVRGAGLALAWRAPKETMEEVVEHMVALGVGGDRVALQLFDLEGHPSTEALRAAAGELVEVPVYQWCLPEDLGPARRLELGRAGRLRRAGVCRRRPGGGRRSARLAGPTPAPGYGAHGRGAPRPALSRRSSPAHLPPGSGSRATASLYFRES